MTDLKLRLGLGESGSSTAKLKHLNFVRAMVIQMLTFWWNVYNSTKLKSGPLQPIWGAIEIIITTIFGPIYHLVMEIPDDILVFLDMKLEGHIYMFHKYAPEFLQNIVGKIHDLNVKALEVLQKFIGNIHTLGLHGAFISALSDIKKFFIGEVWAFLQWLRKQPIIHSLEVHLWPYLLPLLVDFGESYNSFVKFMSSKGFPIFRHLPLVPVELLKVALELQRAAHALNPFDKDKNLPAPSLPVPSLPAPTLPVPSLPAPTLPVPSLPSPSLPVPSLPSPSLPSFNLPTLPIPQLPNPLDQQKQKEGLPPLPVPNLPNPLDHQKKKESSLLNPLEALKEKDNPAFI
ncbi:REF/SRPP-like protein At1g67360 [Morus notabilis]|uniref:REF/SRPP-like protein At1g67360 n=1 Tax=Morus notabilis TaxID=981085 RepID=UPI000CED7099|nr:REF/SRPP-like protein At1g67360 [Morus notabilis]